MNGQPRDQISTDLQAGRPTISQRGDPLALRVAELMSRTEAEGFFDDLETRARRSPAYADWLRDPTRYLADLDIETATGIETHLEVVHRRMVARARERGWEVDDDRA